MLMMTLNIMMDKRETNAKKADGFPYFLCVKG